MSCVILLLQSWPMWEIPEIPFTQGRPKGSPLWESNFFQWEFLYKFEGFNGNIIYKWGACPLLRLIMKAYIIFGSRGRCSQQKHIARNWKNKTAAWNNVWVQSCYILYILNMFFSSTCLHGWSHKVTILPFQWHTHTWPTYSTKPMFATYFFGIQATLPDSRKKMFFFSAFGGRINLLPGSSHPSFRPVGNLGDTGDSHLTLPVHLQVYLYIYIYPLLFNIAMENGPFMDDFPIKTFICKGLSTNMLNGIYIHPISHEKWALSTWNRSFPWTKTPCDQPNFTKLTIHVVPFL